MAPVIRYADRPPGELPARFPSPFGSPHAIARDAADDLIASLSGREQREGKMFGVLVVRDRDGRVGSLRGFSGMLDGSWFVEGFVPPAFDIVVRDAFWPAGEAELAAIEVERAAAAERVGAARLELGAIDDRHARDSAELRERHRANREHRHAQRSGETDPQVRHAIDQDSRADTAVKRRMTAHHALERAPVADRVAELAAIVEEIEARRAERSRGYLHAIHDTYHLANARGDVASLRELFAPDEPPGGAGDCAAPKLLAYAYAHDLQPIALAEVWWGPSPAAGGRHAGAYYPACRGKCGPILAHMLVGLDAEPAPLHASDARAELVVVYEDAWLVSRAACSRCLVAAVRCAIRSPRGWLRDIPVRASCTDSISTPRA